MIAFISFIFFKKGRWWCGDGEDSVGMVWETGVAREHQLCLADTIQTLLFISDEVTSFCTRAIVLGNFQSRGAI